MVLEVCRLSALCVKNLAPFALLVEAAKEKPWKLRR